MAVSMLSRGDLFRVKHPSDDSRKSRVVVIVSRQELVERGFSEVICAPVYTKYRGLITEVEIGPHAGLKHASAIACDNLRSIAKSRLTNYVGSLPPQAIVALRKALRIALDVEDDP